MGEAEQKVFSSMGYRVRIYTPIGKLLPGIGYLVRRLLENTLNQGFIRLAYREHKELKGLLSRPALHSDSKDDSLSNKIALTKNPAETKEYLFTKSSQSTEFQFSNSPSSDSSNPF